MLALFLAGLGDSSFWVYVPYYLLIWPLEWLIKYWFTTAYSLTGSAGWSILLLSAGINTLLLPLYYLGDKIQLREQALQASLKPKLDEFRRAFSGTMQHMVQKTLYRQRAYHPIYALRSSIGFAIQVPFFIAAYRFLSHQELFQGQSWGPIIDLSRPDRLLGGDYGNLLPWLMTALNLLSSLVYMVQIPYCSAASKRQFWGIAILFLLLLYHSSSALLLYWSFSNLYSLVKNLLSRKQGIKQLLKIGFLLWHPTIALAEYTLAVSGLFLLARFKVLDSIDQEAQQALYWGTICWYSFVVLQLAQLFWQKRHFMFVVQLLIGIAPSLLLQVPQISNELSPIEQAAVPALILSLSLLLSIPSRLWHSRPYLLLKGVSSKAAMQLATSSMAALLGLILFNSSALLYSSPSESPQAIPVLLGQVWPILGLSLLVLLALLFYYGRFAKKFRNTQPGLAAVAFLASGSLILALGNNFALKYDYGVMTTWVFNQPEKLSIPLSYALLTMAAMPVLYLLWLALLARPQIFIPLGWILAASLWLGSAYYSWGLLQHDREAPKASSGDLQDVYSYSPKQNNVVIIMLDRFVGPYLQDILQLDPELEASLEGFTWYKNTLSPGPYTISGLTALLGGHEYTPDNIAQLPGSLKDKVNQAYLTMPKLFQQNGYETTVTDPSWANFEWKGDLELFREQGIRAERLKGRYTGHWLQQNRLQDSSKLPQPKYTILMVLQAIFRTLPAPLAVLVYDNGSWLGSNFSAGNLFYNLVDTWSTLVQLPQISNAKATSPQFVFMTNDTPHEPMLMGYTPNDEEYPFQPMLKPENPSDHSPLPAAPTTSNYSLRHFYANWATMKAMQRYLEWMKQQGVYDNSLIILASDHGRDVQLNPQWPKETDYAYFMPLLLVKLPGAIRDPVWTDLTAHSIADVPAFASLALPSEQQRNPFTRKALKFHNPNAPRYAHYIGQNPNSQKSNRFDLEKSYRIDGPIWQESSWQELR